MNVTGWFSGTTGSVPAGFLVAPSHELIGMTLGGVINMKNGPLIELKMVMFKMVMFRALWRVPPCGPSPASE